MKTVAITTFLVGGALAALGCASTQVPASRMAETQAAIRSADEVGATSSPRAALHLRLAREQYTQAQVYARDGEGVRAAHLLERAEADAELAMALAREAEAQAQAQTTLEQVRGLQGRGAVTPSSSEQAP